MNAKNIELIEFILKVLELKFDDDESEQEKKQAHMKLLSQAHARMQLERYVKTLDGQKDLIQKLGSPWLPLMNRTHRQRVYEVKTTTSYFDRLSTNALQNVMEYFDTWGTDFIKMRCINKKTKSAYMA